MGISISWIRDCRNNSARSWERMADDAETADARAEVEQLWRECVSCYEAAIDSIRDQYADWRAYARQHLEKAAWLERQGGDDSDARSALEELDEVDAEEEVL